ncbi:UNVERIFIED_CONTAM: hypothetical protein FKN15_062553 [Acipenser sinensis]
MAEARVLSQMSSGDSSSSSSSSEDSSSSDSEEESPNPTGPPTLSCPLPSMPALSAMPASEGMNSRPGEGTGHLMNTLKNDLQLSESSSESDDD